MTVNAINAIQEAQPHQAPNAFADKIAFEEAMKFGKGCDVWPTASDYEARTGRTLIAIYTSPPASKPWVELTDEEMQALWYRFGYMELMRAIEAKLKEKNT